MSMILMATGDITLGRISRDKDGNVTEKKPATWDYSPDGGSIVVGRIDPNTDKPIEPMSFFGNWDAAGYLGHALDLLNPSRAVNIPNLKEIVKSAVDDGDEEFLCQYCQGVNCTDCIIDEWKRKFYMIKTGDQYC